MALLIAGAPGELTLAESADEVDPAVSTAARLPAALCGPVLRGAA